MTKATVKEAIKLADLSPDCSYILTHLIRQNDGKTDENAKGILQSILGISGGGKATIKASETGYYANLDASILNPADKVYFKPSNATASCFTESTLRGLLAHRQVFNAKYGLSFSRAHLFSAGANPVINISGKLLKKEVGSVVGGYDKVFNHISEPLVPFVNIINEHFDATHEREWRLATDFEFEIENLIFILCPVADFHEFAHLQSNGLPVLFDLDWLEWV